MSGSRPERASLMVFALALLLSACGGSGGSGNAAPAGGSAAPAPAAPAPTGLALVAGRIGGPGNLDGTDGRFAWPSRIALGPAGQLVVADDTGGLRPDYVVRGATVRRSVNPATGEIRTLAETSEEALSGPVAAMTFDTSGNLYEATATAIYRTAPGGLRRLVAGATTTAGHLDATGAAARFDGVSALAADAQGNVYIGEPTYLRRMSPAGVVTTVAGGSPLDPPATPRDGTGAAASFGGINALAIDRAGNIHVLETFRLRVVTPAGAVTTRTLSANDIHGTVYVDGNGIAVDAAGNVYVTDTYLTCRIRKVAPDGTVTDFAGRPDYLGSDDGKGAAADFCPYGWNVQFTGRVLGNLVIDASGNLYVPDTGNRTIRRIAPDGTVTTVAGRARSNLDVDGPAASAQFGQEPFVQLAGGLRVPQRYELAADAQGNVYVGERDRIRKVTAAGSVGTLPLSAPVDPAATTHVGALAFGGQAIVVSNKVISRINADGTLTFVAGQPGSNAMIDGKGAGARFESIGNPVVDGLGNIYLVDSHLGGALDIQVVHKLRKVAQDGTVTTLAILQTVPQALTADQDGNLLAVYPDGSVTRQGADGKQSLVLPANATATATAQPQAIARDRAGNLYIAWHEEGNWYSVHKITPAGADSVIAGARGSYGVRPGVPGSLGPVDGLTATPDGTVYVLSESAVLRIVQ